VHNAVTIEKRIFCKANSKRGISRTRGYHNIFNSSGLAMINYRLCSGNIGILHKDIQKYNAALFFPIILRN
ncbi:MAG: hypothetical protein AAF361_01740, partial [Bacteroidota bacterium]